MALKATFFFFFFPTIPFPLPLSLSNPVGNNRMLGLVAPEPEPRVYIPATGVISVPLLIHFSTPKPGFSASVDNTSEELSVFAVYVPENVLSACSRAAASRAGSNAGPITSAISQFALPGQSPANNAPKPTS
ncbi:hypothetical protein RRF57_005874 [Xylaria bambusicola]|uniref:Secreted protein n=1 Tax=Xylaria bambusicola TaxID=326684 RepID=A0AAN7UMU6_9PEZI